MVTAKASGHFLAVNTYICRSCARRQAAALSPLHQAPRRAYHQNYLRKQAEAQKSWDNRAREIWEGKRQSMLEILESRGYISQIAGTRDSLNALMTEKRVGAYLGVDPTAPSMHVGHLLPFMALYWLYIHGFHVVSLLGGATARIGDPTGRTAAREDADSTTRKIDMVSMHTQLKRLWQKVELHARRYGYEWEWAWHRELVNNNAWLNKLPITEILRLLGPGLRMGAMLGKETVRTKMSSSDGMSFSEFTYPILQSWDWWHMYHTKQIQLQIGGSDQYGNITAGIDAINYINKHHNDPIHRKEDPGILDKPMGFTTPLLTTASGEKFGKSAGNAVWLDKDLTSTFDLYQFFLRTADADVERYLKLFSFIPIVDIETLVSSHNVDPSKRIAQHKLAYEVLCLVHGEADAKEAASQHAQLFNRRPTIQSVLPSSNPKVTPKPSPPENESKTGQPPFISSSLNRHAPITNASNAPSLHITLPRSLVFNRPIARVLYSAGLVASHSEGHRLCSQKGAYVGSRPNDMGPMSDHLDFTPCKNWKREMTERYVIDGKVLVLRVGKWKMRVVKIVSDEEFEAMEGEAPGWPLEEKAQAGEEVEDGHDEEGGDDEDGENITRSQEKKKKKTAKADSELEKLAGQIRALWRDSTDDPKSKDDVNKKAWKEVAENQCRDIMETGSLNERQECVKKYKHDLKGIREFEQ